MTQEIQTLDEILQAAAAAFEAGRFEETVQAYSEVIALLPGDPAPIANRAMSLIGLERFEEALLDLDQVIALAPDWLWVRGHRGAILHELKRYEEALESYESVLALQPDDPQTLNNRAATLMALGRLEEALADCDHALAHSPAYARCLCNRGVILFALRRYAESLDASQQAVAAKPGFAEAMVHCGSALLRLGRPSEALAYNDQALNCGGHPHALGVAADCAAKMCEWDRWEAYRGALATDQEALVPPMVAMTYLDDAMTHRRYAEGLRDLVVVRPHPPLWRQRAPHERIRVGYLSGDLGTHPVGFLMAYILGRSDKSRFEFHGFSFGPDEESEVRTRLRQAFDHFHEVRGLSDEALANVMAELQIDIAVDLGGYTTGGNLGALARRPAPIQVNYLGFPGTLAADFIDYVIADPVVLPFDQQAAYAEAIVHLPDCYLPCDTSRAIAAEPPSREEVGLPADGFVFCCFNAAWKMTPPVFDVWMRLLKAVEGSVLWLSSDGHADANLVREAERRGVNPARLVFKKRLEFDRHLASHRLADIFLDTWPYNAHATASEALFAGLPVLTRRGSAFAGRVGASLLTNLGLPELITESLEDYEALALALARDPRRLATIREKLARHRESSPLFDGDRYVRNLETAFKTMHQARLEGRAPASFTVAS